MLTLLTSYVLINVFIVRPVIKGKIKASRGTRPKKVGKFLVGIFEMHFKPF